MRLRVAGLTLAVRSRQPTAALGLDPEFQPFLVSRGADISLELREEPLSVLPATPPLFDSGGVWCVHEERGRRLYLFATPVLSPPCYKAVRIDSALRKGTLFFPRSSGDGPRHALEFPLDELLFQHRFASDGALEVHACGVVIDGRAVLFLGQSGTGKSTLARLWREQRAATVLSDDRIVLRRHGQGFRAHGTPWHGEGGFATQGWARLGAVFFIRHHTENVARPLAEREATSLLVARAFFPIWDAQVVGRVVETSADIVSTVPCCELGFRPDASAIDSVLRVLSSGAGH